MYCINNHDTICMTIAATNGPPPERVVHDINNFQGPPDNRIPISKRYFSRAFYFIKFSINIRTQCLLGVESVISTVCY